MRLQEIQEIIELEYVKDALKQIHEVLHSLAINNAAILLEEGFDEEHLRLLQQKIPANTKKKVYVDLIAPIFASKGSLQVILAAMGPQGILTVFEDLAIGKDISLADMPSKYGMTVLSKLESDGSSYYDRYYPIWNTYAVFLMDIRGNRYSSWSYSEEELMQETILCLSAQKQKLFKSALPRPSRANINPISTAEVQAHGTLFSAESTVLKELMQLSEAWDSGMVKLTKSGSASETSVKKLQKSFGIQEFHDKSAIDTGYKFLFPMRTRLLLQVLQGMSQKPAKALALLKASFEVYETGNKAHRQPLYNFPELSILLTNLKGWDHLYDKSTYIKGNKITVTAPAYHQLLKEIHRGKDWIMLENANTSFSYDDKHPWPTSIDAVSNSVYYWQGRGYSKERVYIDTEAKYRTLIQENLFRGCIGVMGALGLAELCIEEPKASDELKDHDSQFIYIKAYRLTRLGEYILGIAKDYDTSELLPDQAELSLSNDDLMVLLDKADEGRASVLRFYAQEISSRRFLVNSEAFLKNCKSVEELEERIDNFRRLANQPKLPPNWNAFFNELKQRVISMEPLEDVFIYQLPLDNKPLQHLVATHPEFRKIAEKAEGMKILVAKKNLRKFKSLLKTHGYLWEAGS